MVLYRLVKERYAKNPFEGVSTRKSNGRWNRNTPCIYTAPSLSLATLEILVNVRERDKMDYVAFELEVDDDDVLILKDTDLPEDWRHNEWPSSTQAIGQEWITSRSSLGLMVPSAVVPPEMNVLLNPSHPRIDEAISNVNIVEYSLDPRLSDLDA